MDRPKLLHIRSGLAQMFIWEGFVTTILDEPVAKHGGWHAAAQLCADPYAQLLANDLEDRLDYFWQAAGMPERTLEDYYQEIATPVGRHIADHLAQTGQWISNTELETYICSLMQIFFSKE